MIERDFASEQASRMAELSEMNHWKSAENDKTRAHEIKMRNLDIQGNVEIKKIELAAATKRLKSTTRTDLHARLITNIVKFPAIPFVVFYVFVLELLRRDTPESLERFLEL